MSDELRKRIAADAAQHERQEKWRRIQQFVASNKPLDDMDLDAIAKLLRIPGA